LGLNWLDLHARNYDPQLGRFHSVDPKPDVAGQETLSPYQYGYNNPILKSDPEGDCPNCLTAAAGFFIGGAIEVGGQLLSGKSIEQVDWADVGVEAVKGAVAGSGAGLITTALVEVGGAVVKGSIDFSAEEGNKNIFQSGEQNKSLTEAGFDAGADYVAGKIGGAAAKKLGDSAGNLAKKLGLNSATADRAAAIAKRGAQENPGSAGHKHYAKVLAKDATKEKAKEQIARLTTKVIGSKAGNVVNEAAQNASGDKLKEKVLPKKN